MLLVELRELDIRVSRLSRGEGVVEEESEGLWAWMSCWTLAMAVLDSSTLPEARSLRRAARSLVSWVGAVLGDGVLEVGTAEETLSSSARRVFSIWATAEDGMTETDMRGIL